MAPGQILEGKCAFALCKKPGNKQCKACKNVIYCSVEHQKEDWKRHKGNCTPLILKNNAELGRHFVATRKIEAGTVILEENPLVFGPRDTSSSTIMHREYCLTCCKPIFENKSICPKCTWPLFCNSTCAKAKSHTEYECKHFAKKKVKYRQNSLPQNVLYRGIMILRALLRSPKEIGQSETSFWNAILDLQYKRSDLLSAPHDLFSAQKASIESYFRLNDIWKDWNRINGAIDVNAFSIERVEADGEEASEPTVLYAKASLFAHSCVPNCTWSIGYSPNFTIRVRTSKIIEKGDILFVSYNPNWGCYGTLKRRAMIQEVGGFRCNCSRCMDPTELNTFASSLKCEVETCDGYVIPTISTTEGVFYWQCTNNGESCQNINSKCDFTQKTIQLENEWDEIISSSPLISIPSLIEMIEKFISHNSKKVLHPNHWLIQQASLTVVRALGSHIQTLNLIELQGFIIHCQYLIKVSDILNPGISLQRALIQLYLTRALFLHYKISSCKDHEYTIDQIHQLEEIRSIQLDSFLYWKDDIQSKCLNETMGFEATQLNNEINIIYKEYERLLNNVCLKKIDKV